MPEEFLDYVKQFRNMEQRRTWGELDNHPLVISPDLEQFVRGIVREEVNKAIGEMTRRIHGGEALEVK